VVAVRLAEREERRGRAGFPVVAQRATGVAAVWAAADSAAIRVVDWEAEDLVAAVVG
jgi:hypothetical protein